MKMNKNVLLLLAVLLCVTAQAIAQQSGNRLNTKLSDGRYLEIQVCADDIFRVKLAATNQFPEALLEKYEILKSDWAEVKFKKTDNAATLSVETATSKLLVDKKTGKLSISDKNGNNKVQGIQIYTTDNATVKSLRESLNKMFGALKTSGGLIIGDNGSVEKPKEFENTEVSSETSVIELTINPNERFYGGGGTSRASINHRGEVLRMWAHYQRTEIPAPFIMSNNGWGIFNNNTRKHFFDIGNLDKNKFLIYNNTQAIDFYLISSESMPQILDLYTTITGKPYLLPKWAYGFAFGSHTMEDQMDVMNDAVRFRDERIPCSIYWLEPQWMAKRYDFSAQKNWDLDKFPAEPFWEANNPKKYENRTLFVRKLHELGFHLALWLCIDHDLTIEEDDYLAKKAGKAVSGKEHWFPHLTKFIDQGVDGFKLDPGRTLDEHPDRQYHNGLTDKEMHNVNQVLLPKQMYRTFRDHTNRRSFHHYCGGFSGTQHWSASTSGDNGGGKDALADQLNLGLSGFLNTSADVLEGIDDNIAGLHFGFFLPWVQVNSWYSLHHPWYFKPDVREAFRFYAQMRTDLFPYIYSTAIYGSMTGMPILRAMPLEYPNNDKLQNSMKQYMFGENLLLGIFTDSLYLPEGKWFNYWNNQAFDGDKEIKCNTPVNRGGPLFVKGGAIIPLQKTMNYIGEKAIDTLIVKVYPYKKSNFTLYEDDGVSFEFEKGARANTKFTCAENGKKVEITIAKTSGTYQGMPENRTYQIEVLTSSKPLAVNINGKKADFVTDAKGVLSVFVKGNQNQTIEITQE